MPDLRPLDPHRDAARVLDLFWRSADYVRLERGEDPSEAAVAEFFGDCLPGRGPEAMRKLGLFEGDALAGVIDLGFGYPEDDDAYLGLLQVDAGARGRGLGVAAIRAVEDLARAGGAARLYLAVLHINPRGRAFWEREGFRPVLDREVTLGSRTHMATRMVKDL